MIKNIRRGERPSRPTDPSQNQWLQDNIWDIIRICWSSKPQHRCELSVVHHVFSTPDPRGLLLEFPQVGRKNLVRLEELLGTFQIPSQDPCELDTLRRVQEYLSHTISRDGTSPKDLPSAEAADLVETFDEVPFQLSTLNFLPFSGVSGD
jgi:hypothetical protein